MATFNITKRAFARERVRFTNGGATALTAATYNDTASTGADVKRRASAARLVLDRDAGDLHFSEELTAPTVAVDNTGVGTIAGARDIIILESYEAIVKFKAIALSATNCDVEVVYYR